MRHFIRSLKLGFSEAAGFGGFFFWRGLDRCVGIRGLLWIARGYYFCRATLNEIFKQPQPARPEPAWLRMDDTRRARIRRRVQRYVIELVKSFPDRMAEPRWRALCRLEGREHLEAARQAGRTVVLVFFHFGPIHVMRHWLRGFGFAAAVYIGGDLETRGRVARFQDRRTPFPEVPLLFFPGEMRAVIKFLRAGNILFMAVDLREGQRTMVETEDGWITHLNTGAARLAHLTGADLMAATTVNEDWNRFRIKISPPIAGATLRTEEEWAEANRRLFTALLPDLKTYPDQFVLPILWERMTAPIKAEADKI